MSPPDDSLDYRLRQGLGPNRQELAQMSLAELLELFKRADEIRRWVDGQIFAQKIERVYVQLFVRHLQAEIKKRTRNH